jgi:hypothetical protein
MRVKLTARSLVALRKPTAGKLPTPRESEIQAAVIDFLEASGCVVIRVNSGLLPRADGGRMQCSTSSIGTCSDLLVCPPGGQFFSVEVKRPGGRPTARQSAFLDAVRDRGGIAAVVTSIEDARLALGRCERSHSPNGGSS